ncbi:MAG: hypothetical protein KatS3mg110_2339 [Pirellulaceae bacterium]|nr:MAG: hypothetical protein KatS3mg110_2339 [Pirellulaceae bacterium]
MLMDRATRMPDSGRVCGIPGAGGIQTCGDDEHGQRGYNGCVVHGRLIDEWVRNKRRACR